MPSTPPLARNWLSGLKATPQMTFVWSVNVRCSLAWRTFSRARLEPARPSRMAVRLFASAPRSISPLSLSPPRASRRSSLIFGASEVFLQGHEQGCECQIGLSLLEDRHGSPASGRERVPLEGSPRRTAGEAYPAHGAASLPFVPSVKMNSSIVSPAVLEGTWSSPDILNPHFSRTRRDPMFRLAT